MMLFRTKDLHRVAIKIINKNKTTTAHTSSQSIMNEVEILRKVKHPCIINLEDVIDTEVGI
jgi:serine/threonine protein kinase